MLSAIITVIVILFAIGFIFGIYVQAKVGFKANCKEADYLAIKEISKVVNSIE